MIITKTIQFPRLVFLKTIFFALLFISMNYSVFAGPKSPEFVRTKEWKILKGTSGKIVLTTKAVFYNPNKAKAKLKNVELDIFTNDKLVGNITQIEKLKISGNSSFDIPLRIELDLKNSGLDVVGSIISLMSNKSFLVDMIGHIKIKVLCLPFKVAIDEKQEFSIKDFIN